MPLSSEDSPAANRAWRALLATTRVTGSGLEKQRFRVDSDGGLVATAASDAAAWLECGLGGEWQRLPGAPTELGTLLDLYLPLCGRPVHGRMRTVAHLGQSLDGYIATGSGDSYYVTGRGNLRHLHRLRALCDAVVVGAGTVASDDPRLTTRHVPGRNPLRVIIDPRRRLGAGHKVFTDGAAETLLVVGADEAIEEGARHGDAAVLKVPLHAGDLDLAVLLKSLAARGVAALLIEGGGVTVSRFAAAGLLDRLHLAIAPLIMGAGRRGLALAARERIADCLRPAHRIYRMGADVLFDFDLRAAPPSTELEATLERVL